MESEFVVATFPWKVENQKNPRTLVFQTLCNVYLNNILSPVGTPGV